MSWAAVARRAWITFAAYMAAGLRSSRTYLMDCFVGLLTYPLEVGITYLMWRIFLTDGVGPMTQRQALVYYAIALLVARVGPSRFVSFRLEQEIARAHRYKSGLALVTMDVDHFKQYNDSYGHPVGDAVLSHLASLIMAAVRSTDVVARYGGDEFAVLLVEAAPGEISVVSGRMRERVANHRFTVPAAGTSNVTLPVTVSIGVAPLWPGDSPRVFVSRADAALYEAKRAGRNQVKIASASPGQGG